MDQTQKIKKKIKAYERTMQLILINSLLIFTYSIIAAVLGVYYSEPLLLTFSLLLLIPIIVYAYAMREKAVEIYREVIE